MKKALILMSTVAAFAAAPALWAQEQSTETPAEGATPAPEATEGAPEGLDLGQEANAGPQTYIKETFTDWALQCIQVSQDGAQEVCQMYQLLKDESGASVAEVSLFKLQNGGQAVAGGTFVVPLETLLTAKLTLQVDNGQARQYDYSFCNQIGCYARVGFTQGDVNAMKAGAVAKVTLVPALAADQRVTVNMSLSGFTAAYDNVSALNP